jgi:UPF0271 protein
MSGRPDHAPEAPRRFDLSSDVGERPGPDGLTADAALLDIVTSANVACGGHAGDARSMTALCELAVERGVAIGAQVSYLDRDGFGRRRLDVAPRILAEQLREQWGELNAAAAAAGARADYLRPHGALYNTALVDDEVAAAVLDAAPPATPVLCLAGTALAGAARHRGNPVTAEVFADRAITPDGLLVPRERTGAVIADPAAVQQRLVEWAVTGTLTAIDGSRVRIVAESICIHSDTPGALAAASALRAALEQAGAVIRPFARP